MTTFLKGFTVGAAAAVSGIITLWLLALVILGEEDENDFHNRLAAIR